MASYCGVRGFFFPPSDGTYSGPSARCQFEACEVQREMMSEVLEALNVIRPYSGTPRTCISISVNTLSDPKRIQLQRGSTFAFNPFTEHHFHAKSDRRQTQILWRLASGASNAKRLASLQISGSASLFVGSRSMLLGTCDSPLT